MSDLAVPSIICIRQKQLATLNNTGALLKSVLTDLRARNFVHTKTSLCVRCVHVRHCVQNLSSPVEVVSFFLNKSWYSLNNLCFHFVEI